MAHYEHLPIYKSALDLCIYFEKIVRNFDRHHKKVVISANKIYAAIHHFGGKAGRGKKVTIPARPYMMVQDEDWREMEAALGDFIIQGKA